MDPTAEPPHEPSSRQDSTADSAIDWPLPDGHSLRDALTAAYDAADRSYHDLRHLGEVLARVTELHEAGERFDLVAVRLAAWFHDAIYDGERDAEERSAAWAEAELAPLVGPELTAEVARLVRLTEMHRPATDDANGCALSDADLGILAAGAERYADYSRAIRTEYDHLEDEVFVKGRVAVLTDLLAKPQLFQTAHAHAHWEQPARDNVEAELARLDALAALSRSNDGAAGPTPPTGGPTPAS